MSSPVEDIKAKLSITEVVGSYLKLEKAGVNYKARCPFHNERTPSFFVSPARQTFHCFGCNRGGDIFAFVQEIEGQDFVGALKVLAERAGVEIERSALASNDALRNKLFEILATARNYYAAELSQQPAVLDYLVKRGLTKETIKNWRLGFAPAGWQGLYLFLKNKGYLDRDMEAVGLVLCSTKSGGRRYYDRFRERIMFPLDDSSGRTVGFSGRIFGPERANEGKYVNLSLIHI